MKELKVLKLAFLFIVTLIMNCRLEAQVYFTYPSSGATLYCPVGQTSMDVNFAWSGTPIPDQTGGGYWGYTGNYRYSFSVDNSAPITIASSSYDWGSLGVGQHSAWLQMWEQYKNYDGSYTWNEVFFDNISFRIAITPTHGNKSCAADLNVPGQKQYTQTSDYISPGSIVSYSLSISGIDYGTTFISASSGVNGVAGISREANQPMGTIERSASGSYTMTGGGTLTLYTNVFVGTQGGQAYANASISW